MAIRAVVATVIRTAGEGEPRHRAVGHRPLVGAFIGNRRAVVQKGDLRSIIVRAFYRRPRAIDLLLPGDGIGASRSNRSRRNGQCAVSRVRHTRDVTDIFLRRISDHMDTCSYL